MPSTPVTLIMGDSISLDTDYGDAIPENMYAIARPILGADGYLMSYPGLTKLGATADAGYGRDRGGIYNERFSEQYRISGEWLVRVDSVDSLVIPIGKIVGGSQVALPYSFNTQAIIADLRMYLYDTTSGLNEITDTDLGDPIDGVWINGYYVLTDGEYIYHTDIADESSIDPLKFATAEFMPDKSLGVGKTQDNKIIVFGRYTLEFFQDIASANFAFTRIETRAQKVGIVATHAKCDSGNKWYFTGGHKNEALAVYALISGMVTKISTKEIDKILAKYTEPELSNMRMERLTENDTTFIIIHLPNETICFNESISMATKPETAWSIIKSGVTGNTNYRAINGVFDANIGKWVYGDKRNANIGLLDSTIFTQYEERSEWVLYSPFIKLEGLSINELELETLPGSGVVDEDATVATSLTYDGINYGKEWFELYSTLYDYNNRFIIRRLGYVSDWVGFKFRGAVKSKMAFSLLKVTYD